MRTVEPTPPGRVAPPGSGKFVAVLVATLTLVAFDVPWFAVQMLVPSNAMPNGLLTPGNATFVPAPVAVTIRVTFDVGVVRRPDVDAVEDDADRSARSRRQAKFTPVPVAASILLTDPLLAVQMLVPSNAMPTGAAAANGRLGRGKLTPAPVAGLILVTLPLWFAVHTFRAVEHDPVGGHRTCRKREVRGGSGMLG